jgi:NTP pyrophosphatase (non-canonical NTP hydrolase)
MDIDEYQAKAAETIQFNNNSNDAISISLLGLSGEVGELSTEYKKKIRDGENYKLFREIIIEEIGDVMWYLSSIATHEDIEFSEVLRKNMIKITDRWEDLQQHGQLTFEGEFLDDGCHEDEQFPREFVAVFKEVTGTDGKQYAEISVNGKQFGAPLRDNVYDDDFYRFHDVFHLSYVVVLGWSPIVRRFLECKRRRDEKKDEVEDGGRAAVIDEAISALVFDYASNHNFFEGSNGLDYELLRTIKNLTKHLEVKICTPKEWETAIILGFDLWRELKEKRQGRVVCNMTEKSMIFEDY